MTVRLALLLAVPAVFCVALIATAQMKIQAGSAAWVAIPNGAYVSINGNTFQAECGPDTRAIQQLGDVVRFELVPGNKWVEDSPEAERAELDGYRQVMMPGKDYWVAYSLYIEPGTWSTSDWLAMGQVPGLWGHLISKGAKSFSFYFGGGLAPLARIPISQGVWYNFVEKYVIGPRGAMASWVNGKQVVNHTGTVGAGGKYYPKLGAYRGNLTAAGTPVTESISVRYANYKFGETDLSAMIANPDPVPELTPWP